MGLPPDQLDTVGLPTEDARLQPSKSASLSVESDSHAVATYEGLGRYVVINQLGHGGMGRVLRAYDPKLEREVALKILRADILSTTAQERLVREARAMAKLSHPNVVAVYDVEDTTAGVMLVMEHISGQTLRQWLETTPSADQILERFIEAGRGLVAAHAEGILHRDFKPGNVLIPAEGMAKVTDFGLAKTASPTTSTVTVATDDRPASPPLPDDSNLTADGTVVGTPRYMAPEQHANGILGPSVDQYAFCVTLWEALVGAPPFRGHWKALGSMKRRGPPPWPSSVSVPRHVERALRRGLSPAPEQRWPSMSDLLDALAPSGVQRGRQMWAAAGLVLLLGGGGMALWLARTDDRPGPCQGAEAHLEGLWDEPRRAAVEQALLATGLPYAENTRPRVIAGLDAYAEGWVDTHTRACQATSVYRQQSIQVLDLRMRCLDEHRHALRHTVDLLTRSDATTAENAVQMVSALPDLRRCDDLAALQDNTARLDDPALAAAVDQIRAQLIEIRALLEAERLDDALAVIAPVVDRARALDHASVRAEVELVHGLVLHTLGRFEPAKRALVEAYELAIDGDNDQVAATASTRLTMVEGHQLANHQGGLAWATTAEALARHIDLEGPAHARALRATAIVLFYENDYERVEQRFTHALRIWESQPDEGSGLAVAHTDLGNLRMLQERLEDARSHFDRALQIEQRRLGPGHPAIANIKASTGNTYEQEGRFEEALAEYQDALDLYKKTRPPDHPDIATILNNLAIVYNRKGEHDQALELYARVLEIRETSLGADHPFVARTLNNIGLALRAKGQPIEALAQLQRAVAILERRSDAALSEAMAALSETEFALGRLEDARLHWERTIELVRPQDDAATLARAEFELARVLRAQGHHDRARTLVERALPHVDARRREEGQAWLDAPQLEQPRTLTDAPPR